MKEEQCSRGEAFAIVEREGREGRIDWKWVESTRQGDMIEMLELIKIMGLQAFRGSCSVSGCFEAAVEEMQYKLPLVEAVMQREEIEIG